MDEYSERQTGKKDILITCYMRRLFSTNMETYETKERIKVFEPITNILELKKNFYLIAMTENMVIYNVRKQMKIGKNYKQHKIIENYIKNNFSNINIINNSSNLGYAGGYNEGIKKIDEDLLIFLNNDATFLDENSLYNLVKVFKENSEIKAQKDQTLQNLAQLQTELDRQLYMDLKRAIGDNDLFKVTRMTEASGIGVRFPFLDAQVADCAAKVPASMPC